MKYFSLDVIRLWRSLKANYHNQNIKDSEAEEELQTLRKFVQALKNYHK